MSANLRRLKISINGNDQSKIVEAYALPTSIMPLKHTVTECCEGNYRIIFMRNIFEIIEIL